MASTTSSVHEAALFAAFVDTLIPGDEGFPAASATGTQHWLLDKLRLRDDGYDFQQVIEALGPDFVSASPEQRAAVVARFEAAQPEFFNLALQLVYLGYYQSPLVVRTIQRLGVVYNDAPQPLGYDLGVFDPSLHLPRQPRGAYIPTGQVKRVDLTGMELSK